MQTRGDRATDSEECGSRTVDVSRRGPSRTDPRASSTTRSSGVTGGSSPSVRVNPRTVSFGRSAVAVPDPTRMACEAARSRCPSARATGPVIHCDVPSSHPTCFDEAVRTSVLPPESSRKLSDTSCRAHTYTHTYTHAHTYVVTLERMQCQRDTKKCRKGGKTATPANGKNKTKKTGSPAKEQDMQGDPPCRRG